MFKVQVKALRTRLVNLQAERVTHLMVEVCIPQARHITCLSLVLEQELLHAQVVLLQHMTQKMLQRTQIHLKAMMTSSEI
jgi:hypothetical protein